MFAWFKTRPEPVMQTPQVPVGDDPALEALAAVLRTLGTTAPALDDPSPDWANRMANGWAEHLLLLRPAPETEPEGPVTARDYGSIRRFVLGWRRREVAAVDASLSGLRAAVWALVRAFNQAVGEDAHEDSSLEEQLQRLRIAAELDDPQAVRQVVRDASTAIATAIGQRRRAQTQTANELAAKVKTLMDALHEARRDGLTDALTQLGNRKAFDERLEQAVALGSFMSGRICLAIVDLDHFKSVNDRFGHPAGDAVLKGTSAQMARTFMRKGDFLARYGGEELAAIMTDTSLEDAKAPIERLLERLRNNVVQFGGNPIKVTASVGVAALRPGEDGASWVARADAALYEAKEGGRDRAIYAPE